ncbi:MAG: molybdopterin-dependent oxidoreductase [Deltaproteobacteria bacterium]|nr:molybdopterin-dependent oxidoreductase [Deltaproteobacteria bacterium]
MESTEIVSRNAVVQRLKALHAGEETVYTGCVINCGAGHCVLKVRRKNGKITAIEPDDHYNPGVGREDTVLTDADLVKNRLQVRGCPMAWVFHKLLDSPDRILYPLKRVEGSERMEGRYERISWDEALDLIAAKMEEMVEKYGPYSITTAYQPSPYLERMFGLWGAGVEGWGWCSSDAARLAEHLMGGVPGWSYTETSNDMADVLFNSKLIVLWGFEPSIQHLGPGHQVAYYIRMARERGTPVICIDPRYTVGAQVLADQWIPIKPGTDTAMMLAVANVLIKENLYNREYVEKYVDPRGLEEWRAYLVGEADGIERSPEWAETICGVPAETIREFAHLYARMKPTWIWGVNWGVSRKSRGENTVRAAAALQAIMGNWGVAGGSVPFKMGTTPKPARMLPYGELPKVKVPKMYRSHRWAQMVLLKEKVDSGEMTADEYKATIGWRAPNDLPLPTPKMLMGGGTWLHNTRTVINSADSSNDHIKAAQKMDFVVWIHSHMSPALWISDVILPVADQCLEDRRIGGGGSPGYGGFVNMTYVSGVVEPPGEAKPAHWIYTEIARRLGVGDFYNTYCEEGGDWWEGWEKYLKHEYGRMVEEMRGRGANLPEWEDFKKSGLYNFQELNEKPFHGYTAFIDEEKPLQTKTGKIEIYSYVIGDESERGKLHVDDFGRLIDNLPNDWRDLPPIPAYQPMYRGMDHCDVRRFPLFLLSAYPRYRNHTTFWNVPTLRGDCYRHAAWMNVSDAQARGVKDGDMVRVYNDKGVAVIPAYVTSRVMPGIVVIHHGGNYEPDKEGVDWGCTPNIFFTDPESPVTAPPVSNLIQVERFVGV